MAKTKEITISKGLTVSKNYNSIRMDYGFKVTLAKGDDEEEITKQLSESITKKLKSELAKDMKEINL